MGKAIGKLFFKKGYDTLPNIPKDFWSLSCPDIDGNVVNFSDLQGKYKAFLFVNVASF